MFAEGFFKNKGVVLWRGGPQFGGEGRSTAALAGLAVLPVLAT
jgi:hypothetical protein